jgi:proteasome lid subunit RPN8/RPN11
MNKISIFKQIDEIVSFLKNEGEKNLFCEVCGLIGITQSNKYIYQRMQNRSKEPDKYFIIDPYDYLSFIKENKILGIFHSHLCGDELPSSFDERTAENCCLPFIIYSITSEKFFIYEPQYKDYDVNIIQRLKEKV